MEPVRARIEGGFWGSYQRLVRERILSYQWKAISDQVPGAPKSHSLENFKIAAGRASGAHEGMVFQDSDLYKWLEAAGCVLADHPEDKELAARAAEAVDLISAAQQPDGYINTYFTVKHPGWRWRNLREAHELYCAGHLIEAGVAMHEGTGDRKILEVVRRFADLIDGSFGREPGKIRGYPGHEEVELALVKLFHLTGERRYLEKAKYFIDERGAEPPYFDMEQKAPGFETIWGRLGGSDYYQAHMPIRAQREIVGHAVRAMYMCCAAADIAAETGDAPLLSAADRLWESASGRKMYVTGGLGSSAPIEGFSADWDLPNDTAYTETCAAIGLFLFSSRMTRIHNNARYADVMERALYNGVISGLSLDGEGYFYVNPLEVVPAVADTNRTYHSVRYRRQGWYGCACCPPNVARTLASLGRHAYHVDGSTLYADLYHEGSLETELAGGRLSVRQKTGYPWEETVDLTMESVAPLDFTLALRAPGWCARPALEVNGRPAGIMAGSDGYIRVTRTWKKGDEVRLRLPMAPLRVHADRRVRADYGRVAVQRGPLVYCLEEVDNGSWLSEAVLPPDAVLTVERKPDLLGGITAVTAVGKAPAEADGPQPLYSAGGAAPPLVDRPLFFIPYFAWANRAAGEMQVWVRER